MRAKPDPTGQRFGRLTILGKGKRQGKHQLWRCLCDCGKITEKQRGNFDRKGLMNPSCGCGQVEAARRNANARLKPDCTGDRFGLLTVLGKGGKIRKNGDGIRQLWILQCDCGSVLELTRNQFDRPGTFEKARKSCDNPVHAKGLHYPPTPNPYPFEAGELAAKYLYLCQTPVIKNHQAIEDEKRDRLLRACWILTYRRQKGEKFTELREKRFLIKHLQYAGITMFWDQKIAEHGGFLYAKSSSKKETGSRMTDLTFSNYPVSESETSEKFSHSASKPKRVKFKRC